MLELKREGSLIIMSVISIGDFFDALPMMPYDLPNIARVLFLFNAA